MKNNSGVQPNSRVQFQRRHVALAVILLVSLLAGGAVAQQPAADREAEIDQIAETELQNQHIPAMTVAVAVDGQVVYTKGFGTASLENDVPADAQTLIRTGSLAKPITAAAALTLVDDGKLDLDAPIQRYCPSFPKKQWLITTRELLTHTSGIRHYSGDQEVASTKHYKAMSQAFAIFANDPLLFQPATKSAYSTYGYTVVGCVIEGASSQGYYDYLRQHVLAPAGMTHTLVDDVYAIVPHRAAGYQFKNGKLENAELMDSSYKIPGGGLVSTAEDMVRFEIALMEGKILRTQTVAAMWKPSGLPQLENGKPSNYGMGFGILNVNGERYIAHSGSQPGTSTATVMIPSRRFAVAVFATDEDCNPFDVVRRILDLYKMPRPHPTR